MSFWLLQGGNSDDELSDCLDDDKYDTRDSFIDDSELVNLYGHWLFYRDI